MAIIDKELMLNEHLCYMRAFDHIYTEKVCYKFLIVIIIISYFCYNLHVVM